MAKRFNLPIDDNYTVVDSYYTGPMTDGGGIICDNCSKLITNVVVLKDSKDKHHSVGTDCAKTLSNVNGLYSVEQEFAEANGLRAKVRKQLKENKKVVFEVLSSGLVFANVDNHYIFRKEYEFFNNYLPDFADKIINKQKIGYVPFEQKIEIPFVEKNPKNDPTFSHDVIVHGYKFNVCVKPYGKQGGGVLTVLGYNYHVICKELCIDKGCGMYSQVASDIIWFVNKQLFEKFNNEVYQF